jgi:hypothetical protein
VRLYGKNPAEDPCQSHILTECEGDLVYEPDVQHLHEVEMDTQGNLFVLSAHTLNANNWILVYDEAVGNDSEIRISLDDSNVVVPATMVMSSFDDNVYVATSTSPNLIADVHRFTVERAGDSVSGITYESNIDVNCPEPAICTTLPAVCDAGLGSRAAITGIAASRRDGTVFVTGFTAPNFAAEEQLPPGVTEIFTTAMLAVLPADGNEVVEANEVSACDLVLPFSIVSTALPDKCGGADFGPDGDVNWKDLDVISDHWLETNCAALNDCGGADMEPVGEPDGDVDLRDLAVFAQFWLETGCLP